MFYIHKYSINNLSDALFHIDKLNKLQLISKDNSIPHIIFNGPTGSGTKTIIKLFLEMLYDKDVHKLVDSTYNIISSGNKTKEIVIKQSNYHIAIEPNNNNFDKYLIQNIIKEYAKQKSLGIFTTNRIFKTVLINDLDNLSNTAQNSLRRTLEIYSNSCRFIMRSKSLSKIIEPLRSRCYIFKINSPSLTDIYKTLLNISAKEGIILPIDKYIDIINKSGNNIRKSIWALQTTHSPLSSSTSLTTYDDAINKIIKLLLTKQLKAIIEIRKYIYIILITTIDPTTIIKDIMIKLLLHKSISDDKKPLISNITAKCQWKIIQDRRHIIQFDNYFIRILSIL